MIINQNLGIDSQYHFIASKSSKNTQSHASLFVAQKNSFFKDKLANNDKTFKAPVKPKIEPKAMLKSKKAKVTRYARNQKNKSTNGQKNTNKPFH